MTTLYDIKAALDAVQKCYELGVLSDKEWRIAKRSLNDAAFKNLLSRAKTAPAEVIWKEVDETGFHSVEKAVNRYFGHEE